MEFMLGTESRREYYAFEVAAAAQKMLVDVMLVKPDETVVITADTQSDWRVVEATAQAALTPWGLILPWSGTRPGHMPKWSPTRPSPPPSKPLMYGLNTPYSIRSTQTPVARRVRTDAAMPPSVGWMWMRWYGPSARSILPPW